MLGVSIEKLVDLPMPRWSDSRGAGVRGLQMRHNRNGFTVVEAHYTADPEKRDPEWIRNTIIRGMPPWRRGQEYEIDWEAYGGTKIYPMWDDTIHLGNIAQKVQSHWPRFRGIDYGRTNPCVCLWVAISDPSENKLWGASDYYFYREYYEKGLIIRAHCRNIRLLSGKEQIARSYIDPQTNQFLPNERMTIRDLFTRNGVPTIPADRAKLPGIDRVSKMLFSALCRHSLTTGQLHPYLQKSGYQLDDLEDFAREPAMYFDRSMQNTAREMRMLRKDEYAPALLNRRNPKEEPVSRDDHCPDVIRYLALAPLRYFYDAPDLSTRDTAWRIKEEINRKYGLASKLFQKLTEAP